MKKFVKESLGLMGARIEEAADNALYVETPTGTRAEAVLGGGGRHLLAFSEKSGRKAQLIKPGCQLLDALKFELSRIGSIRHGIYPAKIQFGRKDVKTNYTVFAGNALKFSVRSHWDVTLRCHLKIMLSGNEFIEDIAVVEVSPGGIPGLIEEVPGPSAEMSCVEKPPIKRYQLQDLIKKGLVFAKKVAIEKAEDHQAGNLKDLYTALKRLRTYYRQLKDESSQKGNEDALETYETEYRYRKMEEMQQARVNARIKIIALETHSFPVKRIHLQIERSGEPREVSSVINLFNGKMVEPVRCDLCNSETCFFGLTNSNAIVCADCYTRCEICDTEITGKHIKQKQACSICGSRVCPDHSVSCEVCKELVCRDHVFQCGEGCRICRNCTRYCLDCGNDVIWCKKHSSVNSTGDVTCRNHAVYCIGCHELHPAQKTDTCSACGQTICVNCRHFCKDCNLFFCQNHIEKGRCSQCNAEIEKREIQTQMKLFRQDLAHRLNIRKR